MEVLVLKPFSIFRLKAQEKYTKDTCITTNKKLLCSV